MNLFLFISRELDKLIQRKLDLECFSCNSQFIKALKALLMSSDMFKILKGD